MPPPLEWVDCPPLHKRLFFCTQASSPRGSFWRHAGPLLQYYSVVVLFINVFLYRVDFQRFECAFEEGNRTWQRLCVPWWSLAERDTDRPAVAHGSVEEQMHVDSDDHQTVDSV
mgnify:CR=1 FL=1